MVKKIVKRNFGKKKWGKNRLVLKSFKTYLVQEIIELKLYLVVVSCPKRFFVKIKIVWVGLILGVLTILNIRWYYRKLLLIQEMVPSGI